MENNLIQIDVKKKLISANGPINLNIQANLSIGELVVLFGDSGAGKTTLLRIIAGITMPEEGFIKVGKTVWLDTKSKINLSPQKRNIGFMFQDYALFPNMSVYENIAFAQVEKDNEYISELIHKFGLTEFSERKPLKLSGGQKQRVALARALARKPEILLLDEPLSAIDSQTRTALQEEIIKVHELNKPTILLVSHDLTEVFRLARTVLKIEKGRVSVTGTPDELFSNNHVSGKVQITGNLVKIEKQDTLYLLTIITGFNQIIKVTAFPNDLEDLHEGDQVMVYSKAFNPMITKIYE